MNRGSPPISPAPSSPPPAARPPVSVVVVSRARPDSLRRCLHALSLQDLAGFELVLVADPAGLAVRPDLAARRVACAVPNIAVARNLGIEAASGGIVAFVDDDAVAEPGWLGALTAPFADDRVIAATGFTRGPDGLSWQVRAERIGRDGLGRALPPPAVPVALPADLAGRGAVSTIGTNCAFRHAALVALGGFDPAFAYHLDESDLNLRMAARWPQALTAIVPAAEVVHGLAPGPLREGRGVPRDLGAVGRSHARFHARHGVGPLDREGLVRLHRARLLRPMLAGRLDPLAVPQLLASLRQGLAEGARDPGGMTAGATGWLAPAPPGRGDEGATASGIRPPPDLATAPSARAEPFLPPPFLPLSGTGPRGRVRLAGWHWQARALRRRAAAEVAAGRLVTLLLLTPTLLPHVSGLTDGGWWEQRGGLWGASLPGDPPARAWRPAARIARELARLDALGR